MRIRHAIIRGPAGVDLYWDQQEQSDRAAALHEPRPGAAVTLETFFLGGFHQVTPIFRSNSAVFCCACICTSFCKFPPCESIPTVIGPSPRKRICQMHSGIN